ncbi:MAG: sigma-54-dependent transcriptional regulator [Gammaproteobacteria bacterium]
MSKTRILIADDQPDVREALALFLSGEGYAVETAASPAEVLTALEQSGCAALILDLNFRADTTSGREGLALLKEIRARDADLPVIVLTGWGNVELAVEAMRAGANDFLEKPWENARLLSVINNQMTLTGVRAENQRLRAEVEPRPESEIIFRSRAMQSVMDMVTKVAQGDVGVLITGESGTGKGLVAREIHRRSGRSEAPFVHVNLGALPETLLESELFGHARGAFTDARTDKAGRFELADGGTLFLDEISNTTAAAQSRLLTVLESHTVERLGETRPRQIDVRIVAATNADIAARIAAGEFRGDLFYRLNTVEIHLPPLRERPDDIALLAHHFLARFATRHSKTQEGFDDAASEALVSYDWPGNIRELAHVIERAVLLSEGARIGVSDLRLPETGSDLSLETMSLEQAERYLLRRALDRAGGDAEAAARQLGLSRSALYRRLAKHRT